jgi:NADH:ubiquinone oxidoreductase subunit 2 (subunit N)
MTLLAFLAAAALAGTACVALRGQPRLVRAVATVGLAACLLAALPLSAGSEVSIGPNRLLVTPYLRLWLVAASAALLALHLLGLTTAWQRNAPLAMLGGLATMALALGSSDAAAAFLAAGAGALLALIGSLLLPVAMAGVRLAADALRGAALSAALAVLAAGWVSAAGPSPAPGAVATGYTLMAVALVQRIGAFPVHGTSARIAQTAPLIASPVLVAWLPAAFAAVALGWHERLVEPLQTDLGAARTAVLLVALVTIVLSGVATLRQEDVAQLVAYSVVQDAAFALIALGGAGGSSEIRAWLLLFALAKTAAAGLALALASLYGTRRIPDLAGWARRAPPLGLALVAILVATYGWPGLLPFEARTELAQRSFAAAAPIVLIAAYLPALAFARLGLAGLRNPGPTVSKGPSVRPVPVRLEPPRPARTELVPGGLWTSSGQIAREQVQQLLARVRLLEVAWTLNRAPITASLLLALTLLPLALALGAGDLRGAAEGPSPIASAVAGRTP